MVDETLPPSRADPVIAKLDSPEFFSLFTSELNILVNLFQKYDYELRIAGGAVRDILMNKYPKDLDFATTATPDQMKEMFEKEEIRILNVKGEKHGTITARINDKENFEVTTLRIDNITDGRHAEVEFTKDWKLDACRRDLTINSMFLDFNGKLYDYFYGYDDLKNKKVIFVGNVNTRICEDYLRILRYFRFYGKIMDSPDQHDEATIKAIKDNVNGLQLISGERIWSEWYKILTGKFALELTLKMLECGCGKYMGLPENPNIENFQIVCRRASSNDVALKPISMIVPMLKDEQEVMDVHGRLKLSNADRDLALFLVRYRECTHIPCERPLKPYQQLVFTQQTNRYDVYREYVKEILKYQGAMELLDEFEKWVIPKFPINGIMLKDLVPHPKMIGKVITELKKIWINDDFKNTNSELIDHVPCIINRLNNKITQ
ncbi:CCA tRNA nucleotidyltransferase 1, mitochondrial isoform X2 [Harpegnathos saltator]|uniref:tRNA-nucleotidyltransferase 1, mitochondrial n=2 Tax=Harpegnathos saltator TaxID=610380 RepID=E2BW48_HARSA|nr:CCA tRNA nucleotidyltransferase 1, mitochondrial isoform X2 [Harpegnathos saltator]EFN80080.1 tRNA-nucleotidyltransferase 1, mitochondrial [Harpegnathos saltator]